MENNIFFEFDSDFFSAPFQAHAVGLKKDEKGIWDEWNLIKGNYTGINFPIIFKQEYGKKLKDILDTGFPNFFLISDRMEAVLKKNNLTGWSTFPIKLYDKIENEISGYQGFSVIGRCGPIDFKKSEIVEKRKVPTGPLCKFYKGIYLGLDQWDGKDFFLPAKTYKIIVTKKAADILKKNKITNMRLENISEYEILIEDVPKDY